MNSDLPALEDPNESVTNVLKNETSDDSDSGHYNCPRRNKQKKDQSPNETDANKSVREKQLQDKMFQFWTTVLGGSKRGQSCNWDLPQQNERTLEFDLKRAKAPPREQSSRSKPMPGFAPKKGPEGFKQVGLYDPSAKTKGPRKRRRAPRRELAEIDPQTGAPARKRRRKRRIVQPQPLTWGAAAPAPRTKTWSPYD